MERIGDLEINQDRSSDNGYLTVSFERFGRRGGRHDLAIEAAASTSTDGAWDIELSRRCVSAMAPAFGSASSYFP